MSASKYQSSLTFITESLPGFEVGEEYAVDLQVSGGTPPYAFAITQGALPTGVDLTPTGTVVGVPTEAGDTTVWVKVTDHDGLHLTQAFDAQVVDPGTNPTTNQGPLTIITESLPAFTVGEAKTFSIEVTGGTPPYSFEITQGALPAGLSLGADGSISGTVQAVDGTTIFVKVSDAAGAHITQAFDVQVT